MGEYLIFMDVSGDVSDSYAKENGLNFVPMEYSLGEEMRTCTQMETREILKKFYDGQRNGDFTKTSQISPYMYVSYFKPYFEKGYSVIYLSLSSGLSSTFSSACIAKQELEETFPGQFFLPVDTLAATGGMGVLVEHAVENKKKGMSLEENYEDLLKVVPNIRHWFLVQDLMYLKRGGRISAATATVGTILNVKPILKIDENGKLITIDKKRGDKQAAMGLISLFDENYLEETDDVVYVIDADTSDLGDFVEGELMKKHPNLTIRRAGLSPIIGAHTGPGMVAICHRAK